MRFSRALTEAVESAAEVRIVREEVQDIPDDGIVILATGPLTSPALSQESGATRLGEEHLYFYDAISPIVTAESIDMSVAFRASRYEKGGDDYLNLPLTREEYYRFVDALLTAERVPTHSFERFVPFEGCMPIEEMADRGKETLAFGPMRAVGLIDPRTGTAALCGGAAAPGKPREDALQSGRFSNQDDLSPSSAGSSR